MLLEKAKGEMSKFITELLPALLKTLADEADDVVVKSLEVLARISLLSDCEFQRVLNAIVELFAKDRHLLELRGSLVIRYLCTLLDSKSIFFSLAATLQNSSTMTAEELEFRSIMVQTLSLILLTARELDELRDLLRSSLEPRASTEATELFVIMYGCWCHNPVATLALCLLARAYDLAASLVTQFAKVDVSVGFLMQVDKLVQLLESPVFIQLRLRLLEVSASDHPCLMKSLYGLLMLLPQSTAFATLSTRLATIATLQQTANGVSNAKAPARERTDLMASFHAVQGMHLEARSRSARVRLDHPSVSSLVEQYAMPLGPPP